LSQEDEEKVDELPEEVADSAIDDAELEMGRAVIISLVHSMQLEQSKAQLYFMLIPLAFSAGLLLGYYISFVNL
jgi:hypothetical protein